MDSIKDIIKDRHWHVCGCGSQWLCFKHDCHQESVCSACEERQLDDYAKREDR